MNPGAKKLSGLTAGTSTIDELLDRLGFLADEQDAEILLPEG